MTSLVSEGFGMNDRRNESMNKVQTTGVKSDRGTGNY